MKIVGKVHSTESFGAVDGPGVRYVVFLQGCPLRCAYCHNPDSWDIKGGKEMSTEELMSDIMKYKNYIKDGGVTFSGGEPLVQIDFVSDMIDKCHEEKLHTAVDTSGSVNLDKVKFIIDKVDLVILDIKALDDYLAADLTGKDSKRAREYLQYCESIKKDVWVRHVLVPQITLVNEQLEELAKYLSKFKCVKKVELLPFHKLGEFKWKELDLEYGLYDIPVPTEEEIIIANNIFREYKLV